MMLLLLNNVDAPRAYRAANNTKEANQRVWSVARAFQLESPRLARNSKFNFLLQHCGRLIIACAR